jgi:hypothetical protein
MKKVKRWEVNKAKLQDVDFAMSRGKEWRRHFTAYDGNCDIDIGRAAVE